MKLGDLRSLRDFVAEKHQILSLQNANCCQVQSQRPECYGYPVKKLEWVCRRNLFGLADHRRQHRRAKAPDQSQRHLFYERSLCKFLRNASRIKDGIVNNSLSQSSMHFCKSPRRVRSSKLPQLVHQVFMNYYNHNIFVKSADWDIDQPTNL